MEFQRLDKIISSCGAASRREVKNLVRSGRIAVDGVTVSNAEQKYDPEKVMITLDNKPLQYKKRHIIMLNKPAGYITATEDRTDRTVLDLLTPEYRKIGVFPVGRLDKDTEGLLLLTDDGNFCHNVISPTKKVAKIYYAEIVGKLTEADSAAFEKGIVLMDGQVCMPGKLKIAGEACGYVMVYEGKYHQVKRMFASLGKPVVYLKRVAIGGIKLDETIEKGKFRELTDKEIGIIFDKDEMNKNFLSL